MSVPHRASFGLFDQKKAEQHHVARPPNFHNGLLRPAHSRAVECCQGIVDSEDLPQWSELTFQFSDVSVAVESSFPVLGLSMRKRGHEVLYHVNQWMLLRRLCCDCCFDGNKLKSTAKESWIRFQSIAVADMKKVFGDKIEKVIVCDRLVDSPCVLTASEHGWSANLKRILILALRDNSS